MKYFESDLFGKLPNPESVEELISFGFDETKFDIPKVHMWRGQSDISWPVHSSAFRRVSLEKQNPTERDIVYYESRLLEKAKHRGFHNVSGATLNDFDLLARLQHHGAATRLVDATRNMLVGLFFAANSSPDKTGVLMGWHSDYLGGYEGKSKEDTYEDATEELPKYKHPQTWEPPIVTSRISAQSSQFLYSSVSSQKTGSLWCSSENEALLLIAIRPELKPKIIKILSGTFDIRHLTLFPDIDGFCQANSYNVGQWENDRW